MATKSVHVKVSRSYFYSFFNCCAQLCCPPDRVSLLIDGKAMGEEKYKSLRSVASALGGRITGFDTGYEDCCCMFLFCGFAEYEKGEIEVPVEKLEQFVKNDRKKYELGALEQKILEAFIQLGIGQLIG